MTHKMAMVRVTLPILDFGAPNNVSRTSEARVAKFCTHVEYYQLLSWDDRLPPSGRGQGHVTRF